MRFIDDRLGVGDTHHDVTRPRVDEVRDVAADRDGTRVGREGCREHAHGPRATRRRHLIDDHECSIAAAHKEPQPHAHLSRRDNPVGASDDVSVKLKLRATIFWRKEARLRACHRLSERGVGRGEVQDGLHLSARGGVGLDPLRPHRDVYDVCVADEPSPPMGDMPRRREPCVKDPEFSRGGPLSTSH